MQNQGITYTSLIEPLRLPPTCYLGTGEPLHTCSGTCRAKVRSRGRAEAALGGSAPPPLPRSRGAGPPPGHSPLPTGACPAAPPRYSPPPPRQQPSRAAQSRDRRRQQRSPAEGQPRVSAPGSAGGCRSEAAGCRTVPRTALPQRGAPEPLSHTRGG